MASPETPSNDKARIVEEEKEKMDYKTQTILAVCVVIANVIAVVSLIVALIGVAGNGSDNYYITAGESSGGDRDGQNSIGNSLGGERIWMLQIGHYQSNTQYLDEESQTVQGYNVDVVNAVCQLAGENCVLVWDLYENCWNTVAGQRSRGGKGLMGRWYDGCVGWTNTWDRARTFSFSDDFEKPVDLALYVKPGGTVPSWPDFTNVKVGFLDGWLADQHCLDRYLDTITNFDSSDPTRVIHYSTENEVVAALQAGEIDVLFTSVRPWSTDHPELEEVWKAPSNKCVRGGLGMMVQKDQFEFLTWWNAAFQRLIATSQYDDICERLETAHGDQPGLNADFVCV